MAVNEIAIICDTEEYDSEHILQIITKARSLADSCGKKVIAVCIGKYDEERLKMLLLYGANTIVICERDQKTEINEFADIVYEVIWQRKPEVVMFPASNYGKSVAAILSTRLDAGLTADCIDIEFTDDFYFCRAAISDSVIAKIKCINCDIKMCTVKKDVFVKNKYSGDESIGTVEKFKFTPDGIKADRHIIEIIESVKIKAKQSVDINKYSVVFCIGRGVRQKGTRDKIFDIAEKCGAGVIGTRAAVEEGMIEKARQVGQSGKSISPKVYVSFGVSGATQHMVGIKNAGIIIAVNNDESATIFDYADYPIVEDVDVVVSEMEKMLLDRGQ